MTHHMSRTPAGPSTVVDTDAVWVRLEASLKSVNLTAWKALRPGTTEARLGVLERTLGKPLPDDLRATLLRHDGQEDEGESLFPWGFGSGWNNGHFVLMPVEVIEQHWREWHESVASGAFDGNTTVPDVGVRQGWWCAGWVPFACDHGGTHLCVDLDPAAGGVVGQVVVVWHDDHRRLLVAGSLTELLSKLCAHYESR